MSNVRERIVSYVDRHKAEWEEIALAIHAKPEVSNYEFFASEHCQTNLKKTVLKLNFLPQATAPVLPQAINPKSRARLFVSLRNTMPWLAWVTAADTIFSAHQAVLQAVL